jgi:hypothetical protein
MRHRELAEGTRVQERRPPEPAPLPLHALLAMQQTAGNQAVGRVLARMKVHPNKRAGFLTAAMAGAPAPATADELLLAMLNAYGATFPRIKSPGPWATAGAAIESLTAANKFDEQDEDAFRKAAVTKFPPDAKQVKAAKVADEEETRARLRRERGPVEAKFGDHIFKGITKSDGEPGGYHSIKGNSPTHEAFGDETDLERGVYQQSVRFKADRTNVKKTQSTFFPKAASKDDVLDGITSVFGKTGLTKGTKTMSFPETLKDIRLEQIDGTTIFPAGGGGLTGEGWMSKADREAAKKKAK